MPTEENPEITDETLDDVFNQAAAGADSEPTPEPPPEPSPEPTPEPISEPLPDPTPESDPALESLLNDYKTAGISLDDVNSEADLARAALAQMQQMQPLVRFAQQAMASQQQPEPEPQPAPSEWNASEYFQQQYGGTPWKPEYTSLIESGAVTLGEDGRYAPVPGAEYQVSQILPELNNAIQHSRSFWSNMSQANPYEKFWGAMQEPIQKEIESRVGKLLESREAETRARGAIETFVDQHANWMYQTNPTTGDQQPTEKGQEFLDRYNEAKQWGITDPQHLLEAAMRGFEVPAAKTEPAPEAVEAEKKDSFLESARKRAQHSPTTREPGDAATQAMDMNDLDNLFIAEYRKKQSA